MKSLLPLLLGGLTALALLTGACKKDKEPTFDAVITGYDPRLCACCGELMINFKGETRPFIGDFKLIDNSVDLGIGSSEKFPVYVKVDWVGLPDKCVGNFIKITSLKRQ